MSKKTKKKFRNLSKIVGIGFFTLLMLTNIKFALMDDSEIASGDIALFGIEMQLFDATFATEGGESCCYAVGFICVSEYGILLDMRIC